MVDRLFSRVGAADDLARGRSTFMVEMVETAAILNQAGERSLVILDEIGRGTATFDGLSIAWAAIEHLHETNRCRALFATHFHELTALAGKLPRLHNATVRVKEWQGDVVFLHEVVPGAADRSYGIQVAKLAGLPASGDRARQGGAGAARSRGPRHAARAVDDLPLFAAARAGAATARDAAIEALLAALAALNPDEMSPREALEALYALKLKAATIQEPSMAAVTGPAMLGSRHRTIAPQMATRGTGMRKWLVRIDRARLPRSARDDAQAQTYPAEDHHHRGDGGRRRRHRRGGARRSASGSSEKWGQQVVIENKGGGGHITRRAAGRQGRARRLHAAGCRGRTYVINPPLFPKDKLAYDVGEGPHPDHRARRASIRRCSPTPSLPAKTFAELIALAKQKPGEITYGTAGVGSGPHMNMVLVREHGAGMKLACGPLSRRRAGADRRDRRSHQDDADQRQLRRWRRRNAGKRARCWPSGARQATAELPELARPPPRPCPAIISRHLVRAVDDGGNAARHRDEDQCRRARCSSPSRRSRKTFVKKRTLFYSTMTILPQEVFVVFFMTELQRWAKVIKEQNLEIAQ